MKKTLLFRVDGGRVWGTSMGHTRRALLLAGKLKDRYDTVFIMKNYPDGIEFVRKNGFAVDIINAGDDTDETVIESCRRFNPEKLIVDLAVCPYSRLFAYAKAENIMSVVFDTTGKFCVNADILINDSFVKEFVEYPGISAATRKFLGPKYFIMEENGPMVPPLKKIADIMITFGGSDPAGLTAKIIRSLPEEFSGFKINVVLGPLFSGKDEVLQLAGSRNFIFVYDNPADFISLLSGQDIIITAAGRTLYECAFFGKTVITVPSIEHEAMTSREYAVLTGSLDIGRWEDNRSPLRLAEAFVICQSDFNIRQRIYEKSRQLVDGFGLKRVLEIIN